MPSLDTLHRHIRLIALAAIVISLATWAVDLAGMVSTAPSAVPSAVPSGCLDC